MSDYSNYSASDNDNFSDQEDNYAGAFGGYDDLYDDVIEEAGYDAWDIGNDEFDFDEERYLFEFDPFFEYFDLKDNSDIVTMTYQSLVKLAEMTFQLLGAWKKRSSLAIPEDEDGKYTDLDTFHLFGLNLYQLEQQERDELRTYSVGKLLRIFGGEEEVVHFEEKVDQIVKFLKKVLMNLLGSCLPPSLPYPVVSSILSHLLADKGLDKLGKLTKDDSSKLIEKDYMDKLYLGMADVYDHLKVVMFNIEPNTLATEPPLNEKKSNLFERFQLLAQLVDTSKLESGLETLEIIVTVDEAAMQKELIETEKIMEEVSFLKTHTAVI